RQGSSEKKRHPVRRCRQQRRERLRPALAADRDRDSEDAGHPGYLHGVADDVESVVADVAEAAEVGEEEHLESRPAQHRGHIEARALPGEERPVAEGAAEEEDAQRLPDTSERVAPARSLRPKAATAGRPME